jgi:hypothetical protein
LGGVRGFHVLLLRFLLLLLRFLVLHVTSYRG